MKTDDFNFELPEELIAQYPSDRRGASRLMVVRRDSKAIHHSKMSEIVDFIDSETVLVFNNSRVRKARLYAKCEQTGANVEFVFLMPVEDTIMDHQKDGVLQNTVGSDTASGEPAIHLHAARILPPVSRRWTAVCSKARRQKVGRSYVFAGGLRGYIEQDHGEEKIVAFERPVDEGYFEQWGHVPLPPYIKREDTNFDEQRYQTVYARNTGSAACPTAGLHFTPEIIESIQEKGAQLAFVTLHVGLGTFLPVRTEKVEDHRMHSEWFEIPSETAHLVNTARQQGKKVLAVGTTSLRALESAWFNGALQAGTFTTDIFIYPGYAFKVVDQLFTNFHTPKSTLLMLVSAFAGRDFILDAYREAVAQRYRFFSYGDAMLIL